MDAHRGTYDLVTDNVSHGELGRRVILQVSFAWGGGRLNETAFL